MTDVSEFPYGDRKGISTIETNLLREIRELKFEITRLQSTIKYQERQINELKAIKL